MRINGVVFILLVAMSLSIDDVKKEIGEVKVRVVSGGGQAGSGREKGIARQGADPQVLRIGHRAREAPDWSGGSPAKTL